MEQNHDTLLVSYLLCYLDCILIKILFGLHLFSQYINTFMDSHYKLPKHFLTH